MKAIAAILIFSVGLLSGGCLPLRFTTPSVTGKIYDAVSGQPIEGASVFWASWPEKKEKSQKDGSYLLPPQKRSRWVFPLGDYVPSKASGNIRVEASGYESQKKAVVEGTDFRMSRAVPK
jgi:hypothetical protein